jgi:hypothetical protein
MWNPASNTFIKHDLRSAEAAQYAAEEILDLARIAVRDAASMQKLEKPQKLRQIVDPPLNATCSFALVIPIAVPSVRVRSFRTGLMRWIGRSRLRWHRKITSPQLLTNTTSLSWSTIKKRWRDMPLSRMRSGERMRRRGKSFANVFLSVSSNGLTGG